MVQETEEKQLYCVGCGQFVATVRPGETLAIACRCGANAPILHTKDGHWMTPASFLRATGARIPHLEYYLGYSDHKSPRKTRVTQQLRALGSISMAECEQCVQDGSLEKVQKRIEREKRRQAIQEKGKKEGWDIKRILHELWEADKG